MLPGFFERSESEYLNMLLLFFMIAFGVVCELSGLVVLIVRFTTHLFVVVIVGKLWDLWFWVWFSSFFKGGKSPNYFFRIGRSKRVLDSY